MAIEQSSKHSTLTRVRYAETDTMGVLHHATWVVYWELGRTDLLRARVKPYSEMEREDGILFPVVDFGAEVFAPARYEDEIEIRSRVSKLGRVRLRFAYEGWRGDELLARGHSEHAVIDPDWKVIRLPRELAEKLAV